MREIVINQNQQNNHKTVRYLPSREAAHRTKIIIKSLPPTRMAPFGAGSVHL